MNAHAIRRLVSMAGIVAVLALGGCLPDEDQMLGDPPDLSGTWSGLLTEDTPPQTIGTLELTTSQQDDYVSGNFAVQLSISMSGQFEGWLNTDRTAGELFLYLPAGNCPLRATMSLLGRRIVGNYATHNTGGCTDTSMFGTLDISKQ